MSRRGLQVTLLIVGAVAVTLGLQGVLTGGSGVLDGGEVSANVDSEIRFFAAWYVCGGVFVLRAVRRIELERDVIRVIGAAWFLAACGRVLSIVAVGRPDSLFLVLMSAEFVIPLVVVPWQAAVARAAEEDRDTVPVR